MKTIYESNGGGYEMRGDYACQSSRSTVKRKLLSEFGDSVTASI